MGKKGCSDFASRCIDRLHDFLHAVFTKMMVADPQL